MPEQTNKEKLANLEVQKKYIGQAHDLLNICTFEGKLSDVVTDTRLYLKSFFEILSKTYADLEAKEQEILKAATQIDPVPTEVVK